MVGYIKTESVMIRLFDIQDNKVVLTPNCLSIPQFKAVIDKYPKDALLILTYIDFIANPESPYTDTPEDEKAQIILQDLKLDISLDDLVIEQAIEKANALSMTPTRRFYIDAKIGLEKMGAYMRDEKIVAGRDGNYATYLSSLKSVGAIVTEFKKLEKEYQEEVVALRGNHQGSYDE